MRRDEYQRRLVRAGLGDSTISDHTTTLITALRKHRREGQWRPMGLPTLRRRIGCDLDGEGYHDGLRVSNWRIMEAVEAEIRDLLRAHPNAQGPLRMRGTWGFAYRPPEEVNRLARQADREARLRLAGFDLIRRLDLPGVTLHVAGGQARLDFDTGVSIAYTGRPDDARVLSALPHLRAVREIAILEDA